jgi:alpha-beta hydrolase superfamily lysophospholipase/SAM-dependent methyltransferase
MISGTGEHSFKSWDGAELFYRSWRPAAPSRQALLLFHRGHEHSGRFDALVRDLAPDINVFAWDQRGHGRSPGERGTADDFSQIVRDADAFARHLSRQEGIPPSEFAVLGHSVGGVLAAAWVHDYAPPVRALILATPAFRVKLYVPLALPALRLKQRLLGRGYVKSYVKARVLTHDPAQAEAYNADPMIFRQIADNVLIDLYDLSTRLLEDAGAIHAPTLVIAAGSDWVVDVSAQRTFFERLSSPVKQFELLPGFYHAIFHERDRLLPISMVRAFLQRAFHEPPPRPPLETADRQGYTFDEYMRLQQARPARFARLLMKTVGRLSRGIDLGWRSGFDSGLSLDYVYADQAHGLFDRTYLNSIGWRGIRQRRAHLEARLKFAIEEMRPAVILDVAAGPGRYVLETMRGRTDVRAILRDCLPANVEAGRALARELGVTAAVHELGDAFDRRSLAAVEPRPNIAIVSGLYELFPDNARVLESLRGIADTLPAGGRLIYTNQLWHPQIEFIARTLTNRDGRPWIMRRRTQAEMDELVRIAGFEKIDQDIDRWGIFTVSTARRCG